MEYMMTFHENAADFAKRQGPGAAEHTGAWMAYIGAMREAGVIVSSSGLQPPSTATSLRVRAGQRQVQDGPFADTKEQLGGFVVLEVADLDAALEWAARAPCAGTGGVELRPTFKPPRG